jgi:hypothetical protein
MEVIANMQHCNISNSVVLCDAATGFVIIAVLSLCTTNPVKLNGTQEENVRNNVIVVLVIYQFLKHGLIS